MKGNRWQVDRLLKGFCHGGLTLTLLVGFHRYCWIPNSRLVSMELMKPVRGIKNSLDYGNWNFCRLQVRIHLFWWNCMDSQFWDRVQVNKYCNILFDIFKVTWLWHLVMFRSCWYFMEVGKNFLTVCYFIIKRMIQQLNSSGTLLKMTLNYKVWDLLIVGEQIWLTVAIPPSFW